MTRKLQLSADLALPLEAVTETFAILAKRGVGKTYTGSVLAEEMLRVGAQVVILDPLDAWWGLRSSADGSGPGLAVYVFGGQHGDLALEATAGELLADVVVDHGISAIFSLRHLTKQKQREFVTAFAERLYHRKGEPEHRTPLHVFIDEADAFVPQRVMSDTARMVGAIDDIVRRGRNAGLGATLISQRAAVVNKDVLSQCEVLLAMRTIDTRDRKALDAWIEAHDVFGQREVFMASLASLDVGEAWAWSPGWLNIFSRIHIRQRRTFDSSATPKAGERPLTPTKRAEVNLETLGARITATREQSKANDPRELRQRIAELERREQERANIPAIIPEPIIERVEIPVLNGQVDRLVDVVGELRQIGQGMVIAGTGLAGVADSITEAIQRVATPSEAPNGDHRSEGRPLADGGEVSAFRGAPQAGDTTLTTERKADRGMAGSSGGSYGAPQALGKAERSILAALASYPIPLTRKQLAFLAGYHPRTPGFANALGRLRTEGFVSSAFPAELTEAGRAAAPVDAHPPLNVVDAWIGRFGKAERAILSILMREYPQPVDRQALADEAGYHPRTPGFANALGKLRGLGLVDGYALHEGFARLIELSR